MLNGLARLRCRSGRFWGFILFGGYAGLVGDPVYFPGFAAVVGEGLFEVGGGRGDVRPNKATEDGFAIGAGWFGVEKLAAAIFEFADGGRAHRAALAGAPVEAPLAGLRIV